MRLRVATLNVWALPWGIARHTLARVEAIGEALAGLDADVVALQEVWTADARRILLEHGGRAGLAHRWHNRGGLGASGLLVLSRLPIVEARFDPYLLRGRLERVWHGDYWGGKGFALLGLKTPQGPLAFVNTHLHAQYADAVGDEYHGHVMGQVVQLASALAGVRVPLVAAGDFNLHPDQPHYPALVGLTHLRDAAAERGDAQPTSLRSNPYRAELPDARIDYVFVRDGGGRGIRVVSARRVFDEILHFDGERGAFSDHAAVRVELRIAAPAEPPRPPDPDAVALARRVLEEGRDAAAANRARRRAESAAALTGGGLAFVGARRLGRRGFLRALLMGGGLVALPVGCGLGALTEWPGAEEARAFDTALVQLDGLEGRVGRRSRRPAPRSGRGSSPCARA